MRFKSFIQNYLGQQLLVKLVDAIAVVDYLEPSHHETGNTGFLPILQLLSGRVVLAFHLAMLDLDLPKTFEPAF